MYGEGRGKGGKWREGVFVGVVGVEWGGETEGDVIGRDGFG